MGNNQVEDDDFDETFAPIVKMATVRGLLGLVAAKCWKIHQMDVLNTSDLNEEVYMRLPLHTLIPPRYVVFVSHYMVFVKLHIAGMKN